MSLVAETPRFSTNLLPPTSTRSLFKEVLLSLSLSLSIPYVIMAQDPADSSMDAPDEHEQPQAPPEEDTGISDDNNATNNNNKSALQDNLERKGKNAYYFAHAHKATGPKWDGKQEPKLLAKEESQHEFKKPAFDYSKSNIRKYAFLDEAKAVKLYIDLEGIGERCSDDDIVLEHTSTSMSLIVQNYNPDEPLCLVFGRLTASIDGASWKKKRDKLIVTLTKTNEGEWHTINDKGIPDHQVV